MFEDISKNGVGNHREKNNIVGRGDCPHCNVKVSFRQVTSGNNSEKGKMTPLSCESCNGIVVHHDGEIFPRKRVEGIEGLPIEIQKYYDEALRCITANSPNGAATLFRKVIHAVGIEYEIVNRDERAGFENIIEELEEEGHIQKISGKALDAIKDLGADGAHINENEPDMEQADLMRELVEGVLRSIKTEQRIEEARKKREEDEDSS